MSNNEEPQKKVAKKKTAKKAATKPKVGPELYKRNNYGLLQNVDYTYNEDGSIDWRSMIKPEFLYPNRGWFDIRKQPMPSSIEGLDDKQLLIMLGGIKELAKLRGYNSVKFNVENVGSNYVTAKCSIEWIPNYENSSIVLYEDYANATADNTDDFCIKFLETIACNRAFVRCVRNFLNVHIVGGDEIDKSKTSGNSNTSTEDVIDSGINPTTPRGILEKVAIEKLKISNFEDFKNHLRNLWKTEEYKNESAKEWNSFDDIPVKEARILLGILSKK